MTPVLSNATKVSQHFALWMSQWVIFSRRSFSSCLEATTMTGDCLSRYQRVHQNKSREPLSMLTRWRSCEWSLPGPLENARVTVSPTLCSSSGHLLNPPEYTQYLTYRDIRNILTLLAWKGGYVLTVSFFSSIFSQIKSWIALAIHDLILLKIGFWLFWYTTGYMLVGW